MKKHLVLVINIILVIAIVAAVVFVVFNATNSKDDNENEKNNSAPTFETISKGDGQVGVVTQKLKTYTVGVIQHSNIDNCNDVYDGITTSLGFSGDKATFVVDHALAEDNDKCKEEIQRFIDEDVDAIIAIGPFAAKLAKSMTTDIPIVFAAVQEPAKEGLVESNEVPGGNISGVSDYTPCFEQIYSVKQIFPDCKKIGAIYNATDTRSVEQALMGKKEAERDDVNIPYEQYKVATEDDIEEALESMLDDGVEVIYIPVDKYMLSNIDMVVDFSLKHKIPVFCGNKTMLDKGCFATRVINYQAIGNKVSEMVVNVLVNGADISKMPVSYDNDCDLYINQSTLSKLGVTIPADIAPTAAYS